MQQADLTKDQTADLILTNGNIITLNKDMPKATTVAVKNGQFMDIGNKNLIHSWKGRNTEVVDLRGKTLLPGFIESHMHPTIYGLNLLEVDCRPSNAPTIDHILGEVSTVAQSMPQGQWIRGYGWNDTKLLENRYPTRWELDRVAPNHPVILKRTDNHMSVVNSKALELSGITEETSDPEGGHIQKDPGTGELTGLLQENAMALISVPEYTVDDITKGMKKAQEHFAKWGITTVHDMLTLGKEFSAYQRLIENKDLKVRVRPWFLAIDEMGHKGILDEVLALGIRTGFGNDLLKVQGVKFFLDGSGSGGTAAVSEPYDNSDYKGILYHDEEFFTPYVKKSVSAGLRVAVHAIGDSAIEVAVKSFESAQKTLDITSMRNRVEHCALPTDDHLSRMKKLNLVAASSVGFIYDNGDSYLHHLGSDRMERLYPHKSFKEYGIVAPGNSDLPVVNGNPFEGIYGAVTRKTATGTVLDDVQNISVMDALKAYTTDAAYSSFEEESIGVIKKYAKADMIVVSDNPFDVDHENLKEIEVEQTYMNGLLMYSK